LQNENPSSGGPTGDKVRVGPTVGKSPQARRTAENNGGKKKKKVIKTFKIPTHSRHRALNRPGKGGGVTGKQR